MGGDMSEEAQDVTLARVLAGHLKLREKKSELKRAYDLAAEEIDKQVEKIEAWLLAALKKAGTDNLKVRGVATAYTQVKTKASAADWELIRAYMKEHEAWDFLEKRISSTFVKNYIEEHGSTPPGVNVFQETEVVVRKD